MISVAGMSFDCINRSADGFRAANGTSAGSREALAFFEDKAAVKTARCTANQGGFIANGPLHMGKMLVHLFLADTQ